MNMFSKIVLSLALAGALVGCAASTDDGSTGSAEHGVTMTYSNEWGGDVLVAPAQTPARPGDTITFRTAPENTMVITFANGFVAQSIRGTYSLPVTNEVYGHYACQLIVNGKPTVSDYGGEIVPDSAN